ncbi:lipoprotein signal peptide [Paraburkholderia sp. DHOC27]|uniref:alpha/beta hydrolase family protein n=1 Tax=Paraburkholderia sp. DHOC27 TaxID=2303330 RepID=UPI000E3D8D8E|nr:lipoprotein signal peptide [Paraburkholderia sp. DHOC27]RFU49310.1 lipoprotein signal peptide [Paraburkholderia sp. DHOC27]
MKTCLPTKRRAFRASVAVLSGCLTLWSSMTYAQTIGTGAPYPVGMTQLEYVDPAPGHRALALTLFYPAVPQASSSAPLRMPFFTNLHLYRDADIVADSVKRPLVMFSHGHGSNGLYYAWFAEYLASRGYIVATLYHYRANTYDVSIMYTRSKLWQRPLDISKDITFLENDRRWGPHIDPDRIGVAGHSQGGFTSLWIGGATVNEEKYRSYLRRWKNDPLIPASLRKDLPLDPSPALKVHDSRIKAAFAMAPGDLPGFGMDEAGLQQLKVPAYIIVGARDTQAPAKDNAEFAARYAPNAHLDVLPGAVDHEIFVNECDQDGRDTWPEACIDAAGVDRAQLHEYIGNAALKFFDANLHVQ